MCYEFIKIFLIHSNIYANLKKSKIFLIIANIKFCMLFSRKLLEVTKSSIQFLLPLLHLYCSETKFVFGKNYFCQLILLFNLFLLLFIDLIVLFNSTYGSYCTISANSYLYLPYFQQKNFSFNKISRSQRNTKCCESLWEGSRKLGEIFWCLTPFYLFILFDNNEAYFQMFRRCILILKMNGIFS